MFGGAVEVYGIDDCNKYPATYEDFYDFFLQDEALINPTPQWSQQINVHTCGERIDIISPNLVNMFY